MPITLSEAKEASQDKLTNFVIDEFRKSALLDALIFDNTVKPQGGQTMTYSYNRVTTLPTAAGRAINSEYEPQEAKTTRVSVDLKVFGGSYELDRVIINHEHQVYDHIQFQTEQKVQATRALFHDWFINGDEGDDPLEFDGLDVALTGSSTEYVPEAPIELQSAADIDANWQGFMYALRQGRALMDGAPTLHLMNSYLFAAIQSVADYAGITLLSVEGFGDEVLKWGNSLFFDMGDKPGTSDPIIPIAVDGTTSLYIVRMGLDAVHGVSPDGNSVVATYLPDLKAPGAVKLGEVEMVASVAIKRTRSAAVIRDIQVVAPGASV